MTRGHLGRLDVVFNDQPIFFVTTCTHDRRGILSNRSMHSICVDVWRNAEDLYGWKVGRYVIMPDHVHFFCAPMTDQAKLEIYVGKWKEWTAKYAARTLDVEMPLWQAEFFDHILRSGESYEEKWLYIRDNPVRAKLVTDPEDWPCQGELNQLRGDDI
jgi:REP-associated tyrosine transposase